MTILVTLTLISTIGCSPKVITGHYSNYSNSKISFNGKELWLDEDETFRLNEWTDNYSSTTDENGERHCDGEKGKGVGIYKIVRDTIQLHFKNNDFITCEMIINDKGDAYEMEIKIKDELNEPSQAVFVKIKTKKGTSLKSKVPDGYGKVRFEVGKNQSPQFINISTMGSGDLDIDIPDNLGKSEYKFKRCFGYYEKEEIEKMLFKIGRNYIEYKKAKGNKVRLKKIKQNKN